MKRITKYIVVGLMIITAFISGIWQLRQYSLQQQLAKKVIRFHVLANSDSEADQTLKLAVRDAVGGYLHEKIEEVTSREACEGMIAELLPEIEQEAMTVIAEEGYAYEVHAELTECDFPVKTYGSYTFPAGTYEALRVTIGEGEGANWWCVMYPNMCFENSMYEVVDENAKEALREVLDEEEYQAVLESGNYQIRFRLFELCKEALGFKAE